MQTNSSTVANSILSFYDPRPPIACASLDRCYNHNMSKPGVKNIVIGIGLLIIGGAVTGFTYASADPGGSYLLAWGPMIAGAASLIWGLIQFISFSAKSSEQQEAHYAKIEIRAIIIAMIHQAMSDGELDGSEAAIIKNLFHQYTGLKISDETFNELAAKAKSDPAGYLEELGNMKGSISDQTKGMIVRMSYLVLLADGVVEETEAQAIFKIAGAVGVKRGQAEQIIEEVKNSLEN